MIQEVAWPIEIREILLSFFFHRSFSKQIVQQVQAHMMAYPFFQALCVFPNIFPAGHFPMSNESRGCIKLVSAWKSKRLFFIASGKSSATF